MMHFCIKSSFIPNLVVCLLMLFVLGSGTAAAKPGGNKLAPFGTVPMTSDQDGDHSSPIWAAETPSGKTEIIGKKTMRTVIDAINRELLTSDIKATGNRGICSG